MNLYKYIHRYCVDKMLNSPLGSLILSFKQQTNAYNVYLHICITSMYKSTKNKNNRFHNGCFKLIFYVPNTRGAIGVRTE